MRLKLVWRISTLPFFWSNQRRCTGTFCRLSGKDLWNSTSPENKRTGRGKRARIQKKKDFSKKVFGEGDAGVMWPGLNEVHTAQARVRTPEEQAVYLEERKAFEEMRKATRNNTVRGWTGGHWGGVDLGTPAPLNGISFDDFKCTIMDVARVSHMSDRIGRVYGNRAMVAVGNGKGMIGVSSSVATDLSSALRKARNRALSRLKFVERFEERTVFEDIYVNHHRTWMSIRKQPLGYGLRCHRALADMCRLIGISDIYIKVFGSTRMLNLLKCFVKGMLLQETYQAKADQLGYHLVEFDELNHNYPNVLASPVNGKVNDQPYDDYQEYLDQELITRDVRYTENPPPGYRRPLSKHNRGIPVPASPAVPQFLANIRNFKID
ncbi:small ribosomal subunit protein uS5m-like [Clavelina lepadiformis]|uniref:Small ribosomal subunit protein uS5m n=1 Tax=Clavelina lepadiformis TaxID=159417 RepID=A0ABP0F1J8_CLALP